MAAHEAPARTSENSLFRAFAPVLGGSALMATGLAIEAVPLLPGVNFNLPFAAFGLAMAGIGFIITYRAAHKR